MDGKAVKLLNQLTGAKVVITSSWGENAISSLTDKGLVLPILGCTNKVHYRFDWACRGNEIEEWLLCKYGGIGTKFGSTYDSEEYEYVILDDWYDMDEFTSHFVWINPQYGLRDEDISEALRILNEN